MRKIGSSRSVGQNGGRKHQLFCCLVQPNGARHSLRGDRPTRQAFLAAALPRQNYACAAGRGDGQDRTALVESIRIPPWDGQTRVVEKGESL